MKHMNKDNGVKCRDCRKELKVGEEIVIKIWPGHNKISYCLECGNVLEEKDKGLSLNKSK